MYHQIPFEEEVTYGTRMTLTAPLSTRSSTLELFQPPRTPKMASFFLMAGRSTCRH